MTAAALADDPKPRFPGLRRHWQVLRESWAYETAEAKSRQGWREADFLPAALEVVETPPNPLGRTILWVLIGFVALAILWSFLARIDVVAVAPGKVVAVGRNKLVQAADAGVVRAIHIRDGDRVRRGQPLVTLDPTTSDAEQAQAAANLQTAVIDVARGRALLAALQGRPIPFAPPPGTPPEVAETQRALIRSRLDEVAARQGTLRQQAAESSAVEAGAAADVARLEDTLPYLSERVDRRRTLVDKGYASRLVQRQNAARARASRAGIAQQIAMARAEAIREVLADLTAADAQARLAREELNKADRRTNLQIVRAPADGLVQQLAVYGEGAVLKAADPILVVVPEDAELVVEAQVLNRDIGFVAVGQPVTIKLEAFPFTRYGTLEGRLAWLSRDAVQDEQLGPVYQARVAVASPTANAGHTFAPGLQATAEIRTAERRVIDYLLSPLERRVSEAGRER